MNKLVAVVFFAFVAVASAGFLHAPVAPVLGAPLIPKVRYNAPEVSVVKQPVTVTQPEVNYRKVEVPYAVPYAVPYSVPYSVPVPVASHVPVAYHGLGYAGNYGFGYGYPFATAPVVKAE